ncbi:helix-turn-helix transcriptional regulator [Oscillatoria sp. FACHB-1407]|uniref:helix-turn-helix domain-containing protein n=1 Tax=Oscillatoria sp. FACHB-1407 TaxID=2692847 RepID=UPI001687C210|nr:helix-turn-helix transcriptional regulator [Oscillatoria sp. FACHB-1407]MBD2464352.1 helix-turn-helix transcriptional regulator [Oscillatoria sp. FACHB-1407]
MPARLQIKAEDCSPLGQFILQYLEQQGISMNRLAELSGVPQPRLRGACFKGTCPTPETLRKLAKVMGKHHLELYTLAYEGRVENLPEDADETSLDLLMRELFETVRELGLTVPKVRPSKVKIRRALLELGFREETQEDSSDYLSGDAASRRQDIG